MKREIQIPRKTINTIFLLVVIIALITGGTLLLRYNPTFLSQIVERFESATPTIAAQSTDPDAQAAVAALTAFYTLDYTETVEQWQARVCVLSTTDGCQLIQSFFASAVRQVVEANQVQTGCTVQAIRLVEDKGDIHTWLLEVNLNHPWPGAQSSAPAYAEVTQTDGTWLLNRILFEQEAARFETPALSLVETPTP